jgi:hypothetical protein
MNRNTNLTAEAFSELAKSAAENLYENCDTYETHDMRTWCKKLMKSMAREARYTADDLSTTDDRDEGDDE